MLKVVNNGRVSLALLGDRVYRLRGAKAKRLAGKVPAEFVPHSVDSSERLVGLVMGHVVRRSRGAKRGWRVLFGPGLEMR